MLTTEEGPKRHNYSWKPHSVGGAQPRFSHPGRCVNSKAWHLSSRPQRWRNTAPSYYFCFVKQAVLWNRAQHHTVIRREKCPPPLCSRFQAHMEAWPVHFRPPHFLNTHPRSGPTRLGQKQRQQSAPQPQRCPDTKRSQNVDNSRRSQFSVVLPLVPGCPNPSRASPELPASPSPSLKFVNHPQKSQTPYTHLQLTDEEEDACSAPQDLNQGHHEMADEMTPTTLSTPTTPSIPATPTTPGTQSTPSSPVTPGTPSSFVTPNSLSDFSRPSSSQFSRSTDLNSSFSDAQSVNSSDDHCEDNSTNDEDNHVSDVDQNNYYQEGCSTSLPELHFSSAGSCSQVSSRMDVLQARLSRSLTSCKQETPSTCLPDTPIYTSKTPQSQHTPVVQQCTYETLHGRHGSSRSGLGIQSQKPDCSTTERMEPLACASSHHATAR
ncbi:uncharacterized protein LOC127164584 isoform X1 [Labeo rohita]|uniref:uncharacterized protein LOC127164584 isoform X1 n=1 Tax=Labeo rohita TaxID=84645 RepID=UPI0021E22884|nr:uncharacterized protein LOC127164584 isoform X1 [Labeo rohita]